jgi:fatty-acyl-CoA synthase
MLASVRERQAALVKRFPVWKARTLHEMLDDTAAEFPGRDYVVTDQHSYSYADIKAMSERVAQGLSEAGIRAGEHVAVLMANYVEFAAIKFAVSRAGATCVPINFLNRRDELGYILKQSDAVLLVTMDRFRNLDYLPDSGELLFLRPGQRQRAPEHFPLNSFALQKHRGARLCRPILRLCQISSTHPAQPARPRA